jgi:hypothetical protein
MSLLVALASSPLLTLLGWIGLSAFTLGAAAAATVLLVRAAAPRHATTRQHGLELIL